MPRHKGEVKTLRGNSSSLYVTFKLFVLASAVKKGATASDVISLGNAVTRREKKAAVAGTLKCQSLCSHD